MSKEDSISDHLKSDERTERKKEILRRASDVKNKFTKKERPKRTQQEIQVMIEDYRDQLHAENMQPPPPAKFVDENGEDVFEDKSEITFGVNMMPQRFKGGRGAGLSPEDRTGPTPEAQERLTVIKDYQSTAVPPPPPTMQQQDMARREFTHSTDLDFVDISSELYREYMYNNGGVMRINNPWKLAISRSGNHRIVTTDGFSYIIVPNWIAIRFKAKEGAPSFVF